MRSKSADSEFFQESESSAAVELSVTSVGDKIYFWRPHHTIRQYIEYLKDAFVINEAQRYDVKGRKYIGTPVKYYFEDIGLRNARLGFRQAEETHLMENIICNQRIAFLMQKK